MATVRHHQLQLARERARLQDEELEASHALVEAVRNVDTNFALSQTNFNRRVASERQVEAVQAAYDAGTVTLDQLLDAQRRRADAESAYYRAIVDYNRSIAQLHFRKGSLLEYNGVFLAEGPWPGKAYFDSYRRARQRDASLFLDYGHSRPGVFSRGPITQNFDGIDAGTEAKQLPPRDPATILEPTPAPKPAGDGKAPTGGNPLEEIPTPAPLPNPPKPAGPAASALLLPAVPSVFMPVSQTTTEPTKPWGNVLTGWKPDLVPTGRVISTPADAAATQGR